MVVRYLLKCYYGLKMKDKTKFSKKIIGTALPILSLKSKAQSFEKNGTFADGMIFLDWLKSTGQSAWQVLPLSETHLIPGSKRLHVQSPYRGYGVGLNPKFLTKSDLKRDVSESDKKVFIKKNKYWLDDYSLFCALRDYFDTDDWTKWPVDIKQRRPKAIKKWRQKLETSYERHIIEQFRLHQSFFELKDKGCRLGVSIIGDMAYYIPLQSPLVWAHQECFDLKANGKMLSVSGLPNSPIAYFGRQVWGHPLYDWQRRSQWSKIIKLWKLRINYLTQLHDILRIDHARGFYYYGAINLSNSKKDKTLKGPGFYALSRIIKYAKKNCLEVFVEDSGDRLKELKEDIKKLEVPGIRLMRFAYNEKYKLFENRHDNIKKYDKNTYAYTSTHDTEPLVGYVKLLTTKEKKDLCLKIGIKCSSFGDKILSERLRDAVLSSEARVVIIPIQDWLLIPDRINKPGTEKMKGDQNWRFRLPIPIEKLPFETIKKHVSDALKNKSCSSKESKIK